MVARQRELDRIAGQARPIPIGDLSSLLDIIADVKIDVAALRRTSRAIGKD